jgi:hypothetical protein
MKVLGDSLSLLSKAQPFCRNLVFSSQIQSNPEREREREHFEKRKKKKKRGKELGTYEFACAIIDLYI